MDHNNSVTYTKKLTLPIYKPCVTKINNNGPPKKTSAEIIREARETIVKNSSLQVNDDKMISDSSSGATVKPVNTQRPFTPKDSQRILFGRNSKVGRPPSSFSLRYLQYENGDFGTPKTVQLATEKEEVEQKSNNFLQKSPSEIFQVSTQDIPITKIKLPSIDICFKPFNKFNFRSTNALEKLPEEYESTVESSKPVRRNAYSSPNENTNTKFDTDTENESSKHNKPYETAESLILEPRYLDNIFPNKQIIYDSGNLFTKRRFDNISPSNPTCALLYDDNSNTFTSTNELLEKLSGDDEISSDDLINYLKLLYECLKLEGYINGGKKVGSKLKLNILKCLYKHVENNNERVLLNIARIILAIKVTGSNLTGVCKLVFKISRDDKNDSLFMENNTVDLFLESLGSASPIEDTEALIYGYGAIKFLTMNSKLLKVILNQGILQLIVLHIKIINNTRIEKVQAPEQTSHVLFQITGALRNLANDERIYEEFVKSGAVSELCQSTELFSGDVDIISNISRILSVISTDSRCCEVIVEFDNIFVVFVTLFEKYPGKQDMIVRLAYTLGNLVAKFDYSRYKFYNARNSMPSLINIIKIYIEKDAKNDPEKPPVKTDLINSKEVGGSTGSTEDVIIKVIRIIANISMNSDVGRELLNNYGAKLIELFVRLLQTKSVNENDELILSILSTFNNLSYYFTTDNETSAFHHKQKELCTELCKIINLDHKECITEAVRVLGNLTRSKVSRKFLVENKILEKLLNFLENADDLDLLKTTVGVFINMMADNATRQIFRINKGISKLVQLLSIYGETDWCLSTLICQVIWNYCIDTSNISHIMHEIDINQLLGLLADYLDEEKIFGITENNTTDISDILSSEEYISWEEFATVGTNLLEKIENYLENDTSEAMDYQHQNSDDDDVYIPIKVNSNT